MNKDKFAFSEENNAQIEEICKKYPSDRRKSAMLPVLDLAQRQNGGWLSSDALSAVSEVIGCTYSEVLEVTSFYSMYYLKPVGKYLIEVCQTLSCKLCGAEKITKVLQNYLEIDMHQTTRDGMFTLIPCECLGACVNAPIVKINDNYYEDITTENILPIIDKLRAGKEPKLGTQNSKRFSSEPLMIEEE